jgi:hypothetical protein
MPEVTSCRNHGAGAPLPLKYYPSGFFHIDFAEVQIAEGQLFLLVGIDPSQSPP